MVLAAGLMWAFGLPGEAVSAMGTNIDLAVRQVTVTPVRAYVGDKVLVEVLIENKAEGSATTNAVIYANGKRAGASRKPTRGSSRNNTDWVGVAGSVPRGSHGETEERHKSRADFRRGQYDYRGITSSGAISPIPLSCAGLS